MRRVAFALAAAAGLAVAAAVAGPGTTAAGGEPPTRTITVTATAYNGVHGQTDDSPHLGAWGDNLDQAVRPGLRVIAVSRDLLEQGLRRGQRVRIHGLKGEFVVLDRMPSRWKNRIDIYMQQDVRAARKWGKRRVKLSWR